MATVMEIETAFWAWAKDVFFPWWIDFLKEEIIKRSPTEDDERKMLTRGVVTKWLKGVETTGNVGTDAGERFIKNGPTIRELLASMTAANGAVTHLPEETVGAFSWKRRDGTVHNTQPFDGNFLRAVEGDYTLPWVVRPRPDRKVLEPEPNIFCLEMMKRAQVYENWSKADAAVMAIAGPAYQQAVDAANAQIGMAEG
jgi:hypothetical protein